MGPRLRGLFVTLYGWFRAKEYAPPAKRGSISCPFCCGGLLGGEVPNDEQGHQGEECAKPEGQREINHLFDEHNGRKAPFEGQWLITSQLADGRGRVGSG